MKIEIGREFPAYFKPSYPEEFELFSHFEVTAGIPGSLICNHYMEGKRQTKRVLSCMELFFTATRPHSLP